MFESKLLIEIRVNTQPDGEHAERYLRQTVRHLQDERRADDHARQSRGQDKQRETPLDRFLAQVAQRGADAERHARNLVRGKRHAERQPEENKRREL